MHWGGGTPTFFSADENASPADRRSCAVEFRLRPERRVCRSRSTRARVDPERIALLRRESASTGCRLGVQDFDPDGAARGQPDPARSRQTDAGHRAGRAQRLPLDQHRPDLRAAEADRSRAFCSTLDRIIECDPTAIALYSYAHLPTLFKPQRRILEADLPRPEVKLALLDDARSSASSRPAYVYIGMDHFAKPDDELAVAQRQGRCTAISRATRPAAIAT